MEMKMLFILPEELQKHLFRKNNGTDSIKCHIPVSMEGFFKVKGRDTIAKSVQQSPKAIKQQQYCIF